MQRESFRWFVALGIVGLIATPVPAQVAAPHGFGVVFVADGSGDSKAASTNIHRAATAGKMPLAVIRVAWSLQQGALKDHANVQAHLQAAARIAQTVQTELKLHPKREIYLAGHSSGNHVVLRAAEMLPPKSIERIVLLAPSVAYDYPLERAIMATKNGIDAHISQNDRILAFCETYLGAACGKKRTMIAGRVGFAIPPKESPDWAFYRQLRQYQWNDRVSWTGNYGGHYHCTRWRFLQHYVLPMMMAEPHSRKLEE